MLINKEKRVRGTIYSEPKPPKKGLEKYRHDLLGSIGDRYHYFKNVEDENNYEDFEDKNEIPVNDRQSISLKEVNELLKKENIDPENVYFTATLSDDYIMLEVVNIVKLNYEEQVAEYEELHAQWEQQEEISKKYELERIKYQMEALQKQSEALTAKKKKKK